MQTLNSRQVRYLRAQAHALNPVVLSGTAGYGDTLVKEVNRQLGLLELIKVRLNTESREEFEEMAARLAADCGAGLVQTIGRIAVLFRQAPEESRFTLP